MNYLYATGSDNYTSIAHAAGLTNKQYGILVGFGFSFMCALLTCVEWNDICHTHCDTTNNRFVVSGLVMGYAVDRTNRVAIIGKYVPVEK